MIADTKTLEFDVVLKEVARFASTDFVKQQILALKPTNDASMLKELSEQTDELLRLLLQLGTPPLKNIYNISGHLKRLKLGGTLSATELRELLMHLVVINQNKNYYQKALSIELDIPYYTSSVEQMTYISDLESLLRNAIDEDGNILDTASFELASIRQKINQLQNQMEQKLNQFLVSHQSMLNDAIITRRNNRFVVPVKVEYKNKVSGVIQDYSQSGETVFIEPTAVLELSNKIQLLHVKEQAEIEKILRELSGYAATYVEEFALNLTLLFDLDFTTSKAEYARKIDAVKVEISEDIHLRKARHPLIDPSVIVANDIDFSNYRAVIITGPNTGGKTVTLKTLGLLACMNQCGMLLPVLEGSRLRIFDHIFADIGDEQSIEQSLSTFSSHMSNLIRITDHLTTDSLILLDELGSGTDPKEGASLAIALVDYFKIRGTYLMATTHYPELKAYAYEQPDTVNASTEFNIDTLSPTYKLHIGIPGRSNAFEISRRLGLNEKIIKSAENITATSDTDVSTLIKKLEEETKVVQDLEMKLLDERKLLDQERASLQTKEETYEQKRLSLEDEMKHKAKVYMDSVKAEAQEIIDSLLAMQSDVKYHTLLEKKTALSSIVKEEKETKLSKNITKEIKVGDLVLVLPYNKNAKVLKIGPNNTYEVKMGIMTTTVKRKDLEFVKAKPKQKVTTQNVFYKRTSSVSMELDLRGYRFEDAMIRLEKYIDELLTAGLKQASIIHGHGTNALKKGVHEYLKTCPYILTYAYGREGEGGSGITNIELK